MKKACVASLGAAVIAAALTSATAAQTPVTFTRDVAPILFEHCATCHRPGEIGGFSLLTYQDVRPADLPIAALPNRLDLYRRKEPLLIDR